MKPKEKLTQAILKAIAEFEEETGVEIQSFRASDRIDTTSMSDLPCRTSSISEIEYEFK